MTREQSVHCTIQGLDEGEEGAGRDAIEKEGKERKGERKRCRSPPSQRLEVEHLLTVTRNALRDTHGLVRTVLRHTLVPLRHGALVTLGSRAGRAGDGELRAGSVSYVARESEEEGKRGRDGEKAKRTVPS